MVFSTNQARHFYNAASLADASDDGVLTSNPTEGNLDYVVNTKNSTAYFSYFRNNNLVRSDLIDLNKVLSLKLVPAAKQEIPLKKVTVTLDSNINSGDPVAGQDYILRITLLNYIGLSEEDQYFKYGAVHATSGMDASGFYKKMAISLAKNFSREVNQPFTFNLLYGSNPASTETVTADTKETDLTHTYTGIEIVENEQPWTLGIYPQTTVNFKVTAADIIYDGDEMPWADNETLIPKASGTTLKNGKRIADLEYFCLGERGDVYRNVGWPNVFPTKYSVDPSKEYDVIEIHYAYIGANESIQKSEKDITIVAEKNTEGFSALFDALKNLVPNAVVTNLSGN